MKITSIEFIGPTRAFVQPQFANLSL